MSGRRIGDWRAELRAEQARSERRFFWACMAIVAGLFAMFVAITSALYSVQS